MDVEVSRFAQTFNVHCGSNLSNSQLPAPFLELNTMWSKWGGGAGVPPDVLTKQSWQTCATENTFFCPEVGSEKENAEF